MKFYFKIVSKIVFKIKFDHQRTLAYQRNKQAPAMDKDIDLIRLIIWRSLHFSENFCRQFYVLINEETFSWFRKSGATTFSRLFTGRIFCWELFHSSSYICSLPRDLHILSQHIRTKRCNHWRHKRILMWRQWVQVSRASRDWSISIASLNKRAELAAKTCQGMKTFGIW